MMQGFNLCCQRCHVTVVVDDVVGDGTACIARGLGREQCGGCGGIDAITQHQSSKPGFGQRIHQQYAVVAGSGACFDQQWDGDELVWTTACAHAFCDFFVDGRMSDGFEIPAGSGIGEHQATQFRRSSEPSASSMSTPKRAAIRSSTADGGTTMSRAIWSVSISFAPSATNSFATVLLPLATPPVRAMHGTGTGGLPRSLLIGRRD